MDKKLTKILLTLLLVLLAAVSFVLISRLCGDSALTDSLLSSIEDKTATVMKLTSASALASAGISAIPGDTATPIAEKLADLTGYFLVILSILYTEKALLTLFGAASFKILIPLACGVGIFAVWFRGKGKLLAGKIALFAVAIAVAIPTSLLVSDSVYDRYSSRINATLSSSEELNEQTAPLAEADEDSSIIAVILNRLSETASSLSDKAANLLNQYVESVAILLVTSCILPCLGLVFILWVLKLLFGVDTVSSLRRYYAGRHPAGSGEPPFRDPAGR